jgi:hypothetical protein
VAYDEAGLSDRAVFRCIIQRRGRKHSTDEFR